MEKRKELRKHIKQLEWEKKMRIMQIEDLNTKARDIQMLQLSEEQKDVSAIWILKHPNSTVLAFLRGS